MARRGSGSTRPEPAREETHAGLMRLYALCGQRQEAILQYERLRKALREEFDAEPCAASRLLHEEIRAGSFAAAPPISIEHPRRSLRTPRATTSPPPSPASLAGSGRCWRPGSYSR